MNRAQRRQNEKSGKDLLKRNPAVARLARQSAINEVCQGENDTEMHRALANVFMDLKERKITKAKYDELVDGILNRKKNLYELGKSKSRRV